MKNNQKKQEDDFKQKYYNFGDIYYDNPMLYYSNGKLISHEGLKHPKNGTVKIFTPKGNLLLEINYKNNKKHGKCTHYYDDENKIRLVEFYRSNKLHGNAYTYDKNGNLLKEELFTDGVKNGFERRYSENGIYLDELTYRNNRVQGKNRYKKISPKVNCSIFSKISSLFSRICKFSVKKMFALFLITFITCNVSYAKGNFKENLREFFQIEDYVSKDEIENDFINNQYLKELDRVCEPHFKGYAIDNKEIQELYKKFKTNKNNMYQNRVLYETARDFANDNLGILENQLENLYKAHKSYEYSSKYGKYTYKLHFSKDELESYGFEEINKVRDMYKEWQHIADEVYRYSFAYELTKEKNYYKNKYGAVLGGQLDLLLLSPYGGPETGKYYNTHGYLTVTQAIPGGVIVSSGSAQAFGYQPHFKHAFIVTSKNYVTGPNITGNFQYVGTYSYINPLKARVTVWKFKELNPPSERFYFVAK